MLITLALLPLKVSVTLAALLTVILLLLVLLKGRQSLALVGMTLAMVGMMWRGEVWKAVCLKTEEQSNCGLVEKMSRFGLPDFQLM